MVRNKQTIIGIGGTNGAGKDTAGHILSKFHNYLFISVTELLRKEAKKRGYPIERECLRKISAEWRRQFGLGVLVDKAVTGFDEAKHNYSGVVMASLRNPGEADRIHELGGLMVWVDADPKVRYERVQANKKLRGRHMEDNKTFEQFMQEEADEMTSKSSDNTSLHMLDVKNKSDVFIDNSEEEIAALRKHIEKALKI